MNKDIFGEHIMDLLGKDIYTSLIEINDCYMYFRSGSKKQKHALIPFSSLRKITLSLKCCLPKYYIYVSFYNVSGDHERITIEDVSSDYKITDYIGDPNLEKDLVKKHIPFNALHIENLIFNMKYLRDNPEFILEERTGSVFCFEHKYFDYDDFEVLKSITITRTRDLGPVITAYKDLSEKEIQDNKDLACKIEKYNRRTDTERLSNQLEQQENTIKFLLSKIENLSIELDTIKSKLLV